MIIIAEITLTLSRIKEHLLPNLGEFDGIYYCEIFENRLSWEILIKAVVFAIYTLFLWGMYQFALNQPCSHTFHFFEGSALDFYGKTYGNYLALVLIFTIAFGAATASILLWKIFLN